MRHTKTQRGFKRKKREQHNPRSGVRLPPIPGHQRHRAATDYNRRNWSLERQLEDEGYDS